MMRLFGRPPQQQDGKASKRRAAPQQSAMEKYRTQSTQRTQQHGRRTAELEAQIKAYHAKAIAARRAGDSAQTMRYIKLKKQYQQQLQQIEQFRANESIMMMQTEGMQDVAETASVLRAGTEAHKALRQEMPDIDDAESIMADMEETITEGMEFTEALSKPFDDSLFFPNLDEDELEAAIAKEMDELDVDIEREEDRKTHDLMDDLMTMPSTSVPSASATAPPTTTTTTTTTVASPSGVIYTPSPAPPPRRARRLAVELDD